MGPAEPVRPAHSAPGSAVLGAGKRAAPAKRVAPATRVASPPGISRSVGNKNSSEKLKRSPHLSPLSRWEYRHMLIFVFLVKTAFRHVAQASLQLLSSSDLLALASQNGISLPCPDWSAVVGSQLTETSAYQVQVLFLPQAPEQLGLQAPPP
ncbi:hypothetical protein AAY473_012346 [Plecturocebus cupreus]